VTAFPQVAQKSARSTQQRCDFQAKGCRTGEIAYAAVLLTAIQGWVADVAAGYEIDYVFGDVGRVVADAFQIFCDQN
jgi:hypothetical protein